MLKLKGNYSYRYVDVKKVYVISNSKPNHSTKMHYYSVPHTPIEQSVTNNVVIGFIRQQYCFDALTEIQSAHPDASLCIASLPFDELKYISSLLKMPVVVVVDKRIENDELRYEIFFVPYQKQ